MKIYPHPKLACPSPGGGSDTPPKKKDRWEKSAPRPASHDASHVMYEKHVGLLLSGLSQSGEQKQAMIDSSGNQTAVASEYGRKISQWYHYTCQKL